MVLASWKDCVELQPYSSVPMVVFMCCVHVLLWLSNILFVQLLYCEVSQSVVLSFNLKATGQSYTWEETPSQILTLMALPKHQLIATLLGFKRLPLPYLLKF